VFPLIRSRRRRGLFTALAAFLAFLLLGAAGCDSSPSAGQQEASSRDGSYAALVKGQPAHSMAYSPTRDTINGWIDTWGKKGAVSYVYLQNSEGKLLGYYVLKGLPVSYCQGLTPPDQVEKHQGTDNGGNVDRPAPGVDGVYYGGSDCTRYYGFTADTGAYIEYTAGLGINVLLYNKPLPQSNNVPNLAPTSK
jgi:hypothetical protein